MTIITLLGNIRVQAIKGRGNVLMLYQKIITKIKDNSTFDQFASLAGYRNGQSLSRALKTNREFDSFNGLVQLVQDLFPDEHIQLMGKFANEINPKNKTARCLLEYLNLHNQFDTLRALIDNMMTCGNATSKEWATIYDIDLRITEGKLSIMEALNEFGKINPKTVDLTVCLNIMKSYCYLIEKNYNFAYQFVLTQEGLLSGISDDYIKDVFLGRILLIQSECQYRNNNIDVARDIQKRIIDEINENRIKTVCYLHYGNSLIMESYDQAISMFNKGMELIKNNQLLVLNFKRSINFTCNFWSNDPLYLDKESKNPSDIHEIAFYNINQGCMVEAIKLLDTINKDELNNNSLGFHCYLRGLISNNENDFCESVINFKKSNDYFFIKLPLMKLQQQGYSEMMIKCILA